MNEATMTAKLREYWQAAEQAIHELADSTDLGDLLEVAGQHNYNRVFYYKRGTVSLSIPKNARLLITAPTV